MWRLASKTGSRNTTGGGGETHLAISEKLKAGRGSLKTKPQKKRNVVEKKVEDGP